MSKTKNKTVKLRLQIKKKKNVTTAATRTGSIMFVPTA